MMDAQVLRQKLKLLASFGFATLLLPGSHAWVAPFNGGHYGLGIATMAKRHPSTRRLPTTNAVNGAGAGGRRRRGCVATADERRIGRAVSSRHDLTNMPIPHLRNYGANGPPKSSKPSDSRGGRGRGGRRGSPSSRGPPPADAPLGTIRANLEAGTEVMVVKKDDQPTGRLTHGFVGRTLGRQAVSGAICPYHAPSLTTPRQAPLATRRSPTYHHYTTTPLTF